MTLDDKVTKLTTNLYVRGSGIDIDNLLLDSLQINAGESEIYGRRVPAFTATICQTYQSDSNLKTTLFSEIGTATITGKYSLYGLIDKLNATGNVVDGCNRFNIAGIHIFATSTGQFVVRIQYAMAFSESAIN